MMGRTIAVMARPLVRGAVKTRLARALGEDGALAVYERLLRGTLASAERVPDAALVLAETPLAGEAAAVDALAGRDRWSRLEQQGGDLGERLAGVFADLFAAGAGAVVVVGSDSPALPPEYLEQAFTAPRPRSARPRVRPRTAATISSASAGRPGHCRRLAHEAADELPHEQPRLLDHTLHAARAAGLQVAQLPLWVDVDEPADLGMLDRLTGDAPLRGDPLTGLREVYLHVTHRCGRACRHCYDRPRPPATS